ncbi:MAG: LysE family translocator [Gammaproteobacteria bacterium]
MQDCLTAFTLGVGLGLGAGVAPGPLTTLVIAQALRGGMREGARVALAPLVTDLPIVLVTLGMLRALAGLGHLPALLGAAGAVYLVYLAWHTATAPDIGDGGNAAALPGSLRAGVIANLLNPHPYLFWGTVGGPLIVREGALSSSAAGFLTGFYLLLIGTKLAIAWTVARLRHRIEGRGYRWTLRVLAALLLGFALLLLHDAARLAGPHG